MTGIVSQIVAFIRARLDEEQAQARDVQLHSPTPWTVADDDSSNIVLCDHDPTHRTDPDEVDRFVAGCEHRQDAEFIAHYDPARVLRGVEAKRRILGNCVHTIQVDHDLDAPGSFLAERVIKLMALEWVTHPQYYAPWSAELP